MTALLLKRSGEYSSQKYQNLKGTCKSFMTSNSLKIVMHYFCGSLTVPMFSRVDSVLKYVLCYLYCVLSSSNLLLNLYCLSCDAKFVLLLCYPMLYLSLDAFFSIFTTC